MTTRDYDDEFAAIAADDALLDGLAWGELAPPDDGLGQLLASWRQELDAVLDATLDATLGASVLDMTAVGATVLDMTAVGVPAETLATSASRHRAWLHRRTAGIAAAALVVVAGSAGAAAASGPHGPLGAVNRVLFGAPAPDDSALLARVRDILDRVQQGIDDARAQGGTTPARLAALGDQLDVAGSLLTTDQTAPPALGTRLTALRADLAGLEMLPPNPPAVGDSGQSARSGGSSGSGSSSGSGHEDGDTRSGSDGGTSGSDGGTSGSDGGTSGSDGGTSGSDGGTSGSDGGTSGSDGGTSGSDGGTSGSDGGTSGSDGGTSGSGSGTDGGSSATS